MDYLNSLISKWMPEDSKRLAVDSHPRLSGVMDTINSTLAHGSKTRLPSKFYDFKSREIIDKIVVEEWFSGYNESEEYRRVGIGALVGDIVSRMISNVEKRGDDGKLGSSRGGETLIKFAMSGCHDTTLAALLCSLGVFEAAKWPPYTSHVAIELFSESDDNNNDGSMEEEKAMDQKPTTRSGLFGITKDILAPEGIGRKPTSELTLREKDKLKRKYVRVLYNDRPMVVPGCRLPGNHLKGDERFCTLVSISEC